jgi:hypothetical protein
MGKGMVDVMVGFAASTIIETVNGRLQGRGANTIKQPYAQRGAPIARTWRTDAKVMLRTCDG